MAPPSGRFIVQLFLVPGLIVGVIALLILGSSYLVHSGHTPEQFLQNLDSDNPEIRWRGAHDLAQVLKRPESVALASDPKFALDLAERLERAWAEVERAEKATRDQLDAAEKTARSRGKELSQTERDAAWRKLSQQRNHVMYLVASLGDFTVPVGAPILGEVAVKDEGAEVKGVAQRRRRAVWALANLGDNVKRRYHGIEPRPEDKVVTAEEKDAAVEALKQEIEAGKGRRAEWARQTLASIENKPSGVDRVLERCAGADDPQLRSLVAHALNFWDGKRVIPTLQKLARDDGRGQRIEITEAD